jgi:hypothetical protein
MSYNHTTVGELKTITLTGNFSGSVANVLTAIGFDAAQHNLKILGEGFTWTNFQWSSGTRPQTLHIENITFFTNSVDGYCIYSRDTQLTMKDVTIDGYSGGEQRWLEKAGGALRLRSATYTGHDAATPTINNVTVKNCCRGLRIQDTTGAYIINCNIVKATGANYSVSDNAIYFAAGSYKSDTGCQDCVFDNCTVEDAGQCAFHNIGGNNNTFKNCTMNGSNGAAMSCYNSNGTITLDNCSFTNANKKLSPEKTPWDGNTDNHNDAAVGLAVEASDTNAKLIMKNCTFTSGDGRVFSNNNVGKIYSENNTIDLTNSFQDGFGNINSVYPSYKTNGSETSILVSGSFDGSLETILSDNSFDKTTNTLKIEGFYGAKWIDFRFSNVFFNNATYDATYPRSPAGYIQNQPSALDIQNITFETTTVNNFCIWAVQTELTMDNVTFDGYSGGEGRWLEKTGGSVLLQSVTMSNQSATTPTWNNVTVKNCCRGLRIQDSSGVYVKNCNIVKATGANYSVSDNALYFAASTNTSATGCQNCVFDNCTVEDAGQCAFQSIGGNNNTFKNCSMNGSNGAAMSCYSTNGTITIDNCSFTNANKKLSPEKTPWDGNTDNHNDAAVGLAVGAGDTNAVLIVKNCNFISGDGKVFNNTNNGKLYSIDNTIDLVNSFTDGIGSVPNPSNLTINGQLNQILDVAGSYNDLGASVTGSYTLSTTGTVMSSVVGTYTRNYSIQEADNKNFTQKTRTIQVVPAGHSPVCFIAGTPITTNQGVIAIEKLDKNVHTIRGKEIQAVTRTVTDDKSLICFEKDSLGKNTPSQKTVISMNHKLMYDGKMVKAKYFTSNAGIYEIPYKGEVLFNVLLKTHEKMIVNNVICETLDPKNSIAQLYMILETLPEEQHESAILQFNKFCKDNNTFGSNKNEKKSKGAHFKLTL